MAGFIGRSIVSTVEMIMRRILSSAISSIHKRSLSRIGLPSTLEPVSLSNDGRRPNGLTLSPCVYGKSTAPFLSGLTKKLVGVSGDPRALQWLHQRLSLAVVRGNATSILACVQV